MDYSLPHAVLAFLQEENSPCLPKSYFISSSTKSTKITLIYTRDKRGHFKSSRKKSKHNNNNNNGKSSRERHSSSSTDDYSQRPHSVHNCRFGDRNQGNQRHRICASTPGRGYSDAARVHEIQRKAGSAKMATDPVVRHSPSKDHLTINHFANDSGDHRGSDSDASYHYAPLSPSSVISERPPTPGRFFEPSDTPRPPTPNASNYASLISSANPESLHPRGGIYQTPSRQPTIEYDDRATSQPPVSGVRHSNKTDSRQSKNKNINETSKTSKTKADNPKCSPPPIRVHSPSPDVPPILTKIHPLAPSASTRPPYQRYKSLDGSRR